MSGFPSNKCTYINSRPATYIHILAAVMQTVYVDNDPKKFGMNTQIHCTYYNILSINELVYILFGMLAFLPTGYMCKTKNTYMYVACF